MSKNFQILQQSANEEVFIPADLPPAPAKISAPVATRGLSHDEILKLVQGLFLHNGHARGPRIVSFCGMAHDDRSSWICGRAGEVLATQVAGSVCMVDAKFGSPQLHNHFGVVNRTGLTNALAAEGSFRSFVTSLPGKNLSLMPSGSLRSDLRTQAERCRTRFAQLREEFNYVLISAPPLVLETEALLMGQLADGIVLVVEANKTRREAVRRAKQRLKTAQVELLGAVLDKRTFPIPEFLYRRL